VFLAFAPLGHGISSGPLEDPVIAVIAARVGKTPAQVLLAWAVQRGHGFAYHAQNCGPRQRESRHHRPSGRRGLTKSIEFRADRGSMKWLKTGSSRVHSAS